MLYEKKVNDVLGIYKADVVPTDADVKVTFKTDAGAVELTRASVLKDDKAGGMLLEENGVRTPVKGFAGTEQVIPPAAADEVVASKKVVAPKVAAKKPVIEEVKVEEPKIEEVKEEEVKVEE